MGTGPYDGVGASGIEMNAAQYAVNHVNITANYSDPYTAQLADTARAILAQHHMDASYWVSIGQPNHLVIDGPGTNDLTASELLSGLDRLTIRITDSPVSGGAHTTYSNPNSPATSNFEISINPNDPSVLYYKTAFNNNTELGIGYMLDHELGHANTPNLKFIVKYAGYGTTNPDSALIEAMANTMGRAFAFEGLPNGYPGGTHVYPTNTEIYNANHTGFVNAAGHLDYPWIEGSAGSDILYGGAGPMEFVGDDGIDTVSYAGLSSPVSANLTPRTEYYTASSSYFSVENLSGSPFGDTLAGSADNNSLAGDSGDDSLQGNAGNDTLNGGDGNDTINGNAGNDSILGGAGNDSILGGTDNDSLFGEGGDDTLAGNLYNDSVSAGDGNDSVIGDEGWDSLLGNAGNDTLSGYNGTDFVYGGAGDDRLYGDSGDDELSGDKGYDLLFGGAGADRFRMAATGQFDWIGDFNGGEGDRIVLVPGTAYSLTISGNQVVIDIGGGDAIGLAGIPLSSFTTDWIVYT